MFLGLNVDILKFILGLFYAISSPSLINNHTVQLYKVGEMVVHTGIPFYETPIRSFIFKNLNLDNLETFNFFNHRSWLL